MAKMENVKFLSDVQVPNITVTGDLHVSGTVVTENVENVLTKGAITVINSENNELKSTLMGTVIRTGTKDVFDKYIDYAMVYDPSNEVVRLGMGEYGTNPDGSPNFTFTNGEGFPIAVRSMSNDDTFPVWDEDTHAFVDSPLRIETSNGVGVAAPKFYGNLEGMADTADIAYRAYEADSAFLATEADYAYHAGQADSDGNGNEIATTYATKQEIYNELNGYLPVQGGKMEGVLEINQTYFLGSYYSYNQGEGFLIDVGPAVNSTMIALHITGNSYSAGSNYTPIDTLIQFYDWNDANGIVMAGGINLGHPLTNISVFRHEGKVKIYIPPVSNFNTLNFTVMSNKSGLQPSAVKTTLPSEGVSNLVTINPKGVPSANKLTNSRNFYIRGGAYSNVASFDGTEDVQLDVTNLREAYLLWGGKNHAGTFSALDAALVEDLSTNKLAGYPNESFLFERSTDNGVTWTSYEADGTTLCTTELTDSSVSNGNTNESKSVNNCHRITILTDKIYCQLEKIAIFLSTEGATGCTCTLEFGDGQDPTQWTVASETPVEGWSGWNIINYSKTIGGSYDSNFNLAKYIRLTFKQTGLNESSSSNLNIKRIRMYAANAWHLPSTLAYTGHLYKIDARTMDATFPSRVLADGGFYGNLEGTASRAVSDHEGNVINQTYAKKNQIISVGEILQTTNPFGGKSLYISKIDDALYAADKRFDVKFEHYDSSGNLFWEADAGTVAKLFNGNYEDFGSINAGCTGKIIITLPDYHALADYPYGNILLSFYYDMIPESVSARVYCNYASQGIGWKDLPVNILTINNGQTNAVYAIRNDFYQISQIEITVTAPAAHAAYVTTVEMKVDRPAFDKTPFLSKYGPETLYYDLTAPNFIGNLNGTASNHYTKEEIDNMKLITVEDIDEICGMSILLSNEVTF